MKQHIRESNLIEDIDDSKEDAQSLIAWKFLKTQKEINKLVLFTTHKLIVKNQDNLLSNQKGNYRNKNVMIGDFFPAYWALIPPLMDEWFENFIAMDPIAAHVRFEKIHPFMDGNGRTGRMLMWWHEIKLGQKPSLIKSNEVDRYEYCKWFK